MGDGPDDAHTPESLAGEIENYHQAQPVDLVSLGAVWSHRLNQSEFWIDRNRREHRIVHMDPEHRLNVLGYLRKHSARLQHVVEMYELSIAEVGDDMAWEAPASPLEWLRTTPLFRSLVAAASNLQ